MAALHRAGEASTRQLGEAATGAEALAVVANTAPDVIVVDLQLPDVRGMELIVRLAAAAPHEVAHASRLLSALDLPIPDP